MNAYLLGLALSLLVSQLVAEGLGVKLYRQPLRLLQTLLMVFIPFILWDLFAILRGHWFFGEGLLPYRIGGILPLEEILFFIIVPYCALNALESFKVIRSRRWLP